jgi:hypothetical protein
MALLAVQNASGGLGDVTAAAATGGGDTVPSGGAAGGWSLGTFLLVLNGDATPTNVTVEGMTVVAVAATSRGIIPIPYKGFGAVRSIAYSKVTSLTVAAVRIGSGV